jgi:hypothetical protein
MAMAENQYQLFRDLDRRCVAGGFKESDCRDIVERKKRSIAGPINQQNPVVREVLEGKETFVGIYDSISRTFRGIRRFVPQPHSVAINTRLDHLARIVPNVGHFRRRSVFAADNPVTCTLYGVIVGLAAYLVWMRQVHDIDSMGSSAGGGVGAVYLFAVVFGLAGFVVGGLAMVRYRTRDPRHIHAREAAAYMDINYKFFRNKDDEGWAHFIRAAGDIQKESIRPD